MHQLIRLTKTIPSVTNLLKQTPLRRGFLLIVLVLALTCFVLPWTARAVSPPPDGGYALFTTAEGQDGLASFLRTVNEGPIPFVSCLVGIQKRSDW